MSYFEEYKDRQGRCEYCSHYNKGYCNDDCYGSKFKDSMDLFTYIESRITTQAEAEFDDSEIGRQLYDRYSRTRDEYLQAEHDYRVAKTGFVCKRIESLHEQINQLGERHEN